MERLQKFIASCGVASRRKAEELIASGKVRLQSLGLKLTLKKIRLRLMANYWLRKSLYIIY